MNIFNKLKSYKKIIAVLIITAVLLGGFNFRLHKTRAEEAYITKVIDGDTLQTAAGDRLRLLGIDTPEIYWESGDAEYLAWEAKQYSTDKLLKEKVELEYDQQKKDHYGRNLVYIFHEGKNFNKKLLEKGYASLMRIMPNVKYEDEFKKTAERARRGKKGIWDKVKVMSAELPVINYKEAENYLGKRVIVKGEIIAAAQLEDITFLNFSQNYRNRLSIIIFKNNLSKFTYQPAEYLKKKEIMVLGEIELYEGTPQIIIENPENIYLD
ncbi:MAG: thermonuclease family protein [Halanaerobium sp.]